MQNRKIEKLIKSFDELGLQDEYHLEFNHYFDYYFFSIIPNRANFEYICIHPLIVRWANEDGLVLSVTANPNEQLKISFHVKAD